MKLSRRRYFEEFRGLTLNFYLHSEWCIGELRIESSHLANTTGVHLLVVWMNCCGNISAFLCEVQVTCGLV